MRLDHPCKFVEGLQTLPAQRCFPLVEEPPCPSGAPVVPELIERLLEQVGLVQAAIGLEQQLQRLLPFEGKVLPMRQQRVLLPFDKAAILARQPSVLALANLVERLAQ